MKQLIQLQLQMMSFNKQFTFMFRFFIVLLFIGKIVPDKK